MEQVNTQTPSTLQRSGQIAKAGAANAGKYIAMGALLTIGVGVTVLIARRFAPNWVRKVQGENTGPQAT
jgi:hypothetical protein